MGIKIGTGGLSVEWIIRATGGELYTVTGRGCAAGCGQLGTAETAERRGISTDTRTLEAGEIYLALAGERFDGHRFIPAAFERGASAVICSALPEDAPEGMYIVTGDSGQALLDIAPPISAS